MLKIIKGLVLAMVILCGGNHLYAAVEAGKAAPDFKLIDSSGASQSLSQYRGKFVVLEWLNYECPFVKKHYDSGNMQSLQKTYGGKEVVWLSVISSAQGKQGYFEPSVVNKLSSEKGASPTAILLDPQGEVGRMYGAKTTPHMFIIDPEGILIYQGAIDDMASADPADIANSKNYVSSALDEAMAGKPVTTPVTKSYGCSVKY